MSRFGFVGPAYASANPLVDAEALINWRAQKAESPNASVDYHLLPTSGLKLFANLGNFPSVRGEFTVSGSTIYHEESVFTVRVVIRDVGGAEWVKH